MDMMLEVVTLPVSDVDRAKAFYESLGWRTDADIVAGDAFRVVQVTPPHSGCSISFGKGLTNAAPGSAQRLLLVVRDIDAARAELVSRGVDVSEAFHLGGGPVPGNHGRRCHTLGDTGTPPRLRERLDEPTKESGVGEEPPYIRLPVDPPEAG